MLESGIRMEEGGRLGNPERLEERDLRRQPLHVWKVSLYSQELLAGERSQI